MGRKRKLTEAEKAAKRERRKMYTSVFVGGKQKRVKRPVTIEGLGRNAGPLWLHQNEK